ncbi:trehalose-phosphatase [Rhodanobacter sp. L36]|uniref:trehalose-phosphatase n=1 Tax=Rhodanobacter sp. L36 TaxID=1747221 RepID=UPI00131D90CE|nr:trehalose-phosphatase [Rhodanobacter sp. L36]
MSTSDSITQPAPTSLPAPPLPEHAPWALLLDVDGTLLDFADDPLAVSVNGTLLDLLHGLHRALHGALALVSGRGLEDLDRLFGRPPWAAIGLHGLQLRHANGSFRRIDVPEEQQARMREATLRLAAQFDDVHVEDKQLSIALHCLGDARQFADVHDSARDLLRELPGYELQPGRRVLEFKPSGMDKGRAMQELLGREPFVGRVPVYAGDDLTDEYAFAVANKRNGISVRIGSREPTLARFTLPGPAATAVWLTRILDTLTHHGTHLHASHTGGQHQP